MEHKPRVTTIDLKQYAWKAVGYAVPNVPPVMMSDPVTAQRFGTSPAEIDPWGCNRPCRAGGEHAEGRH